MNHIIAIATLFGDHDVVQTHIQFWGFILTFFSIIGLLLTINLQRIALIDQTRTNSIQNRLTDIQIRLANKESIPNFELIMDDQNHSKPYSNRPIHRISIKAKNVPIKILKAEVIPMKNIIEPFKYFDLVEGTKDCFISQDKTFTLIMFKYNDSTLFTNQINSECLGIKNRFDVFEITYVDEDEIFFFKKTFKLFDTGELNLMSKKILSEI